MKKNKKIGNKGFTLIELMIVITVIAILAAMVLFGLGAAQKRARDVQRAQILSAIQGHLQGYAGDTGGSYPATAAITALYGAGGALLPYSAAGAANQLLDPGCGTAATPPVDVRTAATCAPVTYSYNSGACGALAGCNCKNASGYYLTLTKEAGGTSYVCSPQ